MIHESADVDVRAIVDETASVWHLAQVREGASIGEKCTIGRGAYVGPNVVVGPNSKIQNGAQIFDPAILGAGVFIGPGAILTNDRLPRAVGSNLEQKDTSDWNSVAVVVSEGASVGAGAICVAPLRIGKWALVGAGSLVVSDVPDFALVIGVPARFAAWVDRSGNRLQVDTQDPNHFTSMDGEFHFRLDSFGHLREADK